MATTTRSKPPKIPRVLAVASGGGHWIELLRLRPAFAGADLTFVTVVPSYRVDIEEIPGAKFHCVTDVTRWNKLKWVLCCAQLLVILVRTRPDAVVSTGALPGFLAARIGKLFGAKVIWIDSIANVEELSMSGRAIGRHADHWFTQWPHLESERGPVYGGAVL